MSWFWANAAAARNHPSASRTCLPALFCTRQQGSDTTFSTSFSSQDSQVIYETIWLQENKPFDSKGQGDKASLRTFVPPKRTVRLDEVSSSDLHSEFGRVVFTRGRRQRHGAVCTKKEGVVKKGSGPRCTHTQTSEFPDNGRHVRTLRALVGRSIDPVEQTLLEQTRFAHVLVDVSQQGRLLLNVGNSTTVSHRQMSSAEKRTEKREEEKKFTY